MVYPTNQLGLHCINYQPPAPHIAVADKDNHQIQVLKLDGTFLFMFGSKDG